MSIKNKMLKRLKNDERGAVLVEFALIAPTFFLLLMGVFDFGYTVYARTVLNGAIQTAARDSALETGATTLNDIDGLLRDRVEDVVPFGNIEVDRKMVFVTMANLLLMKMEMKFGTQI